MNHQNYVFNIGFNKCGTSSLAAALNVLGIRTLHHRFRVMFDNQERDVRLVDFWRNNLKVGRRPFAGLDQSICGYSDFFGEACYQQLDMAYPGSKFILTIRPLEDWLLSRSKHVERNLKDPNYRGGFRTIEIEKWTHLYRNHLEQTRRYFGERQSDLLIIDITSGDGWEKLCQFLSLPIPNEDFPWGNRSA